MKLRSLLGLFGVFALLTPVRAQSAPYSMPPPPAMVIAQRLVNEADTAVAEATRLDAAGDHAGHDAQLEIAQRRYYQAWHKYAEVPASATYGTTPYAGSALYDQAKAQEALGHLRPHDDPNPAIQTLKQLLSARYVDMVYPEKPQVRPYLRELQMRADDQNSHYFPEKYYYAVIDFFVKLTGARSYSYFLALLFISVLLKAAMWPMANKQYKASKKMQKLQPLMKEIQTKYQDDKEKMQLKMMELYKEHGHPFQGCAPALLTMPMFIIVYYMVRIYEFQFSKGTFLWIGSSLSSLHLSFFGLDLTPAADLSKPDVLLLLLYGLTMFVQQKMMPPPADPQQAEQQKMMIWMMPVMSTYFFLQYRWPSAFVLYFLISNLLGIAQQWWQMKSWRDDTTPLGAAMKNSPIEPKQPSSGGNGTGRPRDNGQGDPDRYGAGSENGARPAARGTISPKVHAKKKRR
jgi:YidC/Oxa1 family membrane protein insertase